MLGTDVFAFLIHIFVYFHMCLLMGMYACCHGRKLQELTDFATVKNYFVCHEALLTQHDC